LHLLAPCDLPPIKAAGVTFAASLLERVIEEQARGGKWPGAPRRAQRQTGNGTDACPPRGGHAVMRISALRRRRLEPTSPGCTLRRRLARSTPSTGHGS
jgi:hypothetical protein